MAEPVTKRSRLDDDADEQVDAALLAVIDDASKMQDELEKLNDEASDRVLAIEQEFTKKRRPVYQRRNGVLAKIPGFWAKTLSRHPTIAPMFTGDDLKIMEYCTELDVEDFDDIKSGYQITLTFSSDNPYFSNTQLRKRFHYAADARLSIKTTQPKWNAGMEPGEGEEETVGSKRGRPTYRFMHWFMDEELDAGQHDELADIIKDDVWPKPLEYFTGQALEDDEEFDGEMDEDDMEGADDEGGEYQVEGGEDEQDEGEGDEGEEDE